MCVPLSRWILWLGELGTDIIRSRCHDILVPAAIGMPAVTLCPAGKALEYWL